MRRNVGGQVIGAQLISAADGSAVTSGNTSVYVTVDGGTQTAGTGTGSPGNGDAVHEGNGFWTYTPTPAETNGAHVAFTFVNASAINATVQVYPMAYDADGRVDVGAVAGTAQTAGDIIADTNDIQSRLPAALVSGRMDSNMQAAANGVITAAVIATDAIDADAIADGAITSGVFAAGAITAAAIATDAIDADAIAADAVTEIQAGLSTLDAAGVRTAVGLASANLDTQLSAIAGYIDTEVAAILAAVDAETAAIQAVTDILNGMIEEGVGSPTYHRFKTGALELAPTGGSAPTAAQIADAVWDEATAGHAAAGSFGEQLKTDVDAILADTNELQTDWANGGRLDLLIDAILEDTGTTLPATLATIVAYIDTEVAAILAAVDTEVAAIKAKTDSLNFTVAGQVDVNIQYVNDVQVAGTGALGDEWGPA